MDYEPYDSSGELLSRLPYFFVSLFRNFESLFVGVFFDNRVRVCFDYWEVVSENFQLKEGRKVFLI